MTCQLPILLVLFGVREMYHWWLHFWAAATSQYHWSVTSKAWLYKHWLLPTSGSAESRQAAELWYPHCHWRCHQDTPIVAAHQSTHQTHHECGLASLPTGEHPLQRPERYVSKKTDGKLLLLERSKSCNCPIPQLVSAPLNLLPIVEHFGSSHPQCEHSYWQGIWVGNLEYCCLYRKALTEKVFLVKSWKSS